MQISDGILFEKFARLAGVIVAAMGLFRLAGSLSQGALGTALGGMPAVTAAAFTLAGLALLLISQNPGSAGLGAIVRIISTAVAFIGAITLYSHLHDHFTPARPPFFRQIESPSFLSALNFFLLGSALPGLRPRKTLSVARPVEILIVIPILIAFLALIGHACDVPGFYGWKSFFPRGSMSLLTSIVFIVLGVGMLCARADGSLMTVFRSTTAGGAAARRLLLMPVAIPLVTGVIAMVCARYNFYNRELGGWAISFSNILVFALVIWWVASLLDREGKTRRAVEEELKNANAELEQRVRERALELHRSEEALLRERNLLRLLIDHLPTCIYVKDLQGRFLLYNAASVSFAGLNSEADALGKTVFDFFPAEIASLYQADDERTLASGKAILDREEPAQDAEGTKRWYLTTKLPLRSEGEPVGILGISQDITERKQAETLLRTTIEREKELRLQAQASQDRFRILVERALVGIYIIQDEKFLYVNPCMARTFGRTQEEMLLKPVLEFVLPEDRPIVREKLRQRVEGQVADAHYELRVVRADQSIGFAEARGGLTEINGRPAVLGTLLDITVSKQAEEKIHQLNQELENRVVEVQLETANKELEAFSYTVSHDLRAPLRHILGYVQMLKGQLDAQLSDKALRYLNTITTSAEHMGRLVDGLLSFARLGRVELLERPIDLNQLVTDSIQGLELALANRDIHWRIAPLPTVLGDSGTVKQVIFNLIANAVKYTRHRSPALIEIGSADEKDGWTAIFVRDNGAGFDMKYANKLFGVFQRLHHSEEFEGTGIGLATVQRIILRHGGRVWAEGKLDEGATFYFTLRTIQELN